MIIERPARTRVLTKKHMGRIVYGSTRGLKDVEAFLERIVDPRRTAGLSLDPGQDIYVTRAPGRIDLMGGIADYSGSLVLQLTIADSTLVAVQHEAAPVLTIVSLSTDSAGSPRRFSMPLSELIGESESNQYSAANRYFARDPSRQWAAYVAGCILVLARVLGIRFTNGLRMLIESRVPEGKGVSSSAALEVATMQAIAAAFEITLDGRDLALLCQKVENLVVGAPCGVMDQMTAACGEAGRLLELLCQPAQLLGTIDLPSYLAVWGLDSGVRHFVSGADYTTVRVAAFMGYRIIAELAGLKVRENDGVIEVDDARWSGYLANLSPSEFERDFAEKLPEEMKGSDFITHYRGITDTVTRVDPDCVYRVRTATAHPVYEHFRVRNFAEVIANASSERSMELLGELMYQSHNSYLDCGLGSDGTNLLVQLVKNSGPGQGLYGAKITGGGSGGTVAVLARADAGNSINQIAEEYERVTGCRSRIFRGSSPGSTVFGHLVFRQD